MRYVSIDIETTGLNPKTCQIVEFGAVIEDLSVLKPIEELPKFHCYVLPPDGTYRGEPYALAMHPEIFKRIAKREAGYSYYFPGEVADKFRTFLEHNQFATNRANNITLPAGGKNFAAFDLAFLNEHIPFGENHIYFHHRCVDPAMMFFNATMDKIPDSKRCMELAGIDGSVAHTAVEDAQMVVKLVRKGLKLE